jgi:hypothetical protein
MGRIRVGAVVVKGMARRKNPGPVEEYEKGELVRLLYFLAWLLSLPYVLPLMVWGRFAWGVPFSQAWQNWMDTWR